jgi:hypothetical protein
MWLSSNPISRRSGSGRPRRTESASRLLFVEPLEDRTLPSFLAPTTFAVGINPQAVGVAADGLGSMCETEESKVSSSLAIAMPWTLAVIGRNCVGRFGRFGRHLLWMEHQTPVTLNGSFHVSGRSLHFSRMCISYSVFNFRPNRPKCPNLQPHHQPWWGQVFLAVRSNDARTHGAAGPCRSCRSGSLATEGTRAIIPSACAAISPALQEF